MFFTDIPAYPFIPTKEQIEIAKARGYSVAMLDFGDIPDELKQDSSIKIIQIDDKKI